VGETCQDNYIFGSVNRISPEAPVPILDYIETKSSLGMSHNVKNNLESFGIFVNHITNKKLIKKTRVVDISSNQQLIRIDEDDTVDPIKPSEVRSAFLHLSYDAIVISDYDKGFLTTNDLRIFCQNFNGPVFIDTKKKDLFTEKNVIFKINQREYNNLISYPADLHLIVTMGSEGAKYLDHTFPSEKVNVFDVVGAGDTFLSAFVYSYLSCEMDENRFSDSITYANKAAAIAVQHFGTYTLTKEDIKEIS
jgi:D-beta-D-heptose 7-phosphate kinase/D-beta-D-heptose 1-phosphate adenosyltransferase